MKRGIVLSLLLAWLTTAGMLAQESATTVGKDSVGRLYNVLFHEAMLQRHRGNHDAAFDLLNRCCELKPDASETYFYQGLYYTDMAQVNTTDTTYRDKAMQMFDRAWRLEPQNMTYMERLASSYIDHDQTQEAIAMVERMYDADKSRQELLELLYQLYSHEKDFDKAIEMLDRMELIDGPTEHNTLMKMRMYIEKNDSEHAISEVKKLTARYPNDLSYRTLYANTLLVTGNEEQSFDVLTSVFDEDPDNLKAQQVLRNYFIRRGDEAAADSVNHAILLNPKASVEDKALQLRQIVIENLQQGGDSTSVLAVFNEVLSLPEPSADLAEMKAVYMQLKQMPPDSVNAAYEYVLELAPNHASARLHMVQQAWDDNDDLRIIDLCQQARQYNPEEMAFYYYQGMAYYRQEDFDNSLEAFRNGINVINEESNPEIVSDFYAVMGDLLHQKGRKAEAFAAYDSCLVWKKDNIGCLNNYAYYLSLENERLDEAEQMSYRTVKAEPKNATYLDTYAWILFMQKRYAEARVYIDQALQNDSVPGAVINEHAGDIYALCGDMDAAVSQWAKALADDPQNKLIIRKIKRKKYLKK